MKDTFIQMQQEENKN